MKQILISDITLKLSGKSAANLTFREKLDTAKLLDKLGTNVIEMCPIASQKADSLLLKTVASEIENSVLAVPAGLEEESIKATWDAISKARKPRLQIVAPMSTARMEYVYHIKAKNMLQMLESAISYARNLCDDVEFVAEDATRADYQFLCSVIAKAVECKVSTVTICEDAGKFLPMELGKFVSSVTRDVPSLKDVNLFVQCSNALSLADACALQAIESGVNGLKVATGNCDAISLGNIAKILSEKGSALDASCSIPTTAINKAMDDLEKILSPEENEENKTSRTPFEDGVRHTEDMVFSSADSMESVLKGVQSLGYDLDETDRMKVWEAFQRTASKKETVGTKELEAIVASEAMQVPSTYILESYAVTSSNMIDITAHVKLSKNGQILDGLSFGDGPIDAAFLAIEKITGFHYELDDFQMQAITEGREAMGQAIVKLRSQGRIFSGRGTSTDIIGAGIMAYINALNKIVFEEEL